MAITKIDANGRVLLPNGLRFKLGLKEGDKLAVDELEDGTILLRKIEGSGIDGALARARLNDNSLKSDPISP